MHYVYFVKDSNNNLYIGQTDNIERRLSEHNSKSSKSAKFVRDNFDACKLVYFEKFESRTEAMHRELQIKKWSRAKKEALISQDFKLLKEL